MFKEIKDFEKSINSFKKAIKIDPNFFQAYNNIGLSFYEFGEYEKAINSFEKTLKINPNYFEAYNSIGLAFSKCGKYEEAIDNLSMHFSSLKIRQDQVSNNLVTNINIDIFNEINILLGKNLNVEIVELKNYDSEAIKSLFMNGYLFRVSKKLIISKEHKKDLIKIVEKLPQNFSVADFKEASKLSRKYTIPFLEFLDREAITKKINSNGLRRIIL